MKNKYIIALFVFGMLITIIGSLFKVIHFEIGPVTGNVLLTIGMLTEFVSGIYFIKKLIGDKESNFLNK